MLSPQSPVCWPFWRDYSCCCPGCWRAVSPIRRGYWETWAAMPTNLWISLGGLMGFLLVLARVGGALIFVPLPGLRGAPEPTRAALAVGLTLALGARWPVID